MYNTALREVWHPSADLTLVPQAKGSIVICYSILNLSLFIDHLITAAPNSM